MRSNGTNPRSNTLLMKEDGGWSGGNDVEGALVAEKDDTSLNSGLEVKVLIVVYGGLDGLLHGH